MKSLLVPLLLVLTQVVEVQSACNSTHPIEIPIDNAMTYPTIYASTGYMFISDFGYVMFQTRYPVCVFYTNYTLLEQCGQIANLRNYRVLEQYFSYFGFDNLGRENATLGESYGFAFRSADNTCGLDLQPILEMHSPNGGIPGVGNYIIVTGDNAAERLSQNYTFTGKTIGYGLRCNPAANQTVCMMDPNRTTEVTTKKTTPKPCTGQWSNWAWAAGSKCSDTCGNCGKRARTRTCLTCGCTGAAKDTVPCGDVVCIYPRKSCCAPYVKKVDKTRNLFVTVQSACNASHSLEIPVEAVYKAGPFFWPITGYDHTTISDLPKDEINIFLPVCLFTKNLTLLAQCGNTTSLDRYSLTDSEDYRVFYFLAIDNLGRVDAVKQRNVGLAFRSADNICGLDLQPIREMYKPRVVSDPIAGDNVGNLIADGYNFTGNIVGYSLRCEDNVQYQTICMHAPTQTTTTKKTTPKPCTGQWSNWAWTAGSKCSDTCGNCGKRARTRTCLTCGCTGAAKDTVPCGDVVCIYPRKSCCAPYVKKVDKVRNLFVCG